MKKLFISAFSVACVLSSLSSCGKTENADSTNTANSVCNATAENQVYSIDTLVADSIILPAAQTTGGTPIYDALSARATFRNFTPDALSDQTISNLLWSASGVNRPSADDPRLTAPTARNAQEIDIYVCTKKAVYLYQPVGHKLKLVNTGDFRAQAGKNPFHANASVDLIFVANYDKMEGFDDNGKAFYGATDSGIISQNVYLFCAAENLKTCVCGHIDREEIAKFINLKNGYVTLTQPVGK